MCVVNDKLTSYTLQEMESNQAAVQTAGSSPRQSVY